MLIETKDYGLIAYCILFHNGTKEENGVRIHTDHQHVKPIDITKEYEKSDYSVFNKILKAVIKG